MTDTYIDGTPCPVKCLTPSGSGWREVPMDKRYSMGYPSRAFIHKSNIAVISAVEVASEPGMDKGFEYHISISKQLPNGTGMRCDSNAAKWALAQFGLEGSEEDNHVPHGLVRNFWRPVAAGWSALNAPAKPRSQRLKRIRATSFGGQRRDHLLQLTISNSSITKP